MEYGNGASKPHSSTCLFILVFLYLLWTNWLQQSKVKQVASMVRSCIDPDFGKTALGALQELEALAGGGEVNNAPTHGQTQEPETEALPQN